MLRFVIYATYLVNALDGILVKQWYWWCLDHHWDDDPKGVIRPWSWLWTIQVVWLGPSNLIRYIKPPYRLPKMFSISIARSLTWVIAVGQWQCYLICTLDREIPFLCNRELKGMPMIANASSRENNFRIMSNLQAQVCGSISRETFASSIGLV